MISPAADEEGGEEGGATFRDNSPQPPLSIRGGGGARRHAAELFAGTEIVYEMVEHIIKSKYQITNVKSMFK